MASSNQGKAFELSFKENWKKCFPGTFIYRLIDQVSGYKYTSANICDFFAIPNGTLFMLELKKHSGNTIGWDAIRQRDKLIECKDFPYIRPGVIIWFADHDKIIWVPANTLDKMVKDGKKSINIKMLEDNTYKILEIPTTKKRVFLDADYTVLLDWEDE